MYVYVYMYVCMYVYICIYVYILYYYLESTIEIFMFKPM